MMTTKRCLLVICAVLFVTTLLWVRKSQDIAPNASPAVTASSRSESAQQASSVDRQTGSVERPALAVKSENRVSPARDALVYTAQNGAGPHKLSLRRNGSELEVVDDSAKAVLAHRSIASTRRVVINGSDQDDDTLTVDFSNGKISVPEGIHYDGGKGGYDTLAITGGTAEVERYDMKNANDGVIAFDDLRIVFSNIEPISDTAVAANFVVNGTGAGETINIVNGPVVSGFQTTQVNSGAGLTFESVNFANKTNVTVNGLAGDDTTTLNVSTPAVGLSKLVVDGGSNTNDTISITNFVLAGGTLSLKGVKTVTQTGAIQTANLAVQASGGVQLLTTPNTVATLAGSCGGVFDFANTTSLIIGTVDGVNGVSTTATVADVTLNANGAGNVMTISQPITSAGSIIVLTADDMAINAAVNGTSTGIVILTPFTVARTMDLGTNSGGNLGLTDAELDRITANILQLGSALPQLAGNITNSAAITQTGSGYTILQLNTTGQVINSGGSIAGTNLDIFSGTGIGVGIPLATQVTNLDFNNSTSGTVGISNIGGMNVTNVAGAGNAVNGGASGTSLSTTGGPLTFMVNTTSNSSLSALAVETLGINDDVNVNAGVTLTTNNGDLTLQSGDSITLQPGSITRALAGGAAVTLVIGIGDTDGVENGTIKGTVSSSNSGVFNGTGGNLLIDYAAGANLVSGPGGFYYNGVNSLVVNDAGSAIAHNYVASFSAFDILARDGSPINNSITLFGSKNVTIVGGNASDVFNIRPSAAMAYNVVGNNPTPPALPGDSLNIIPGGATNLALTVSTAPDGFQGSYAFSNRLPVTFTGIETLNPPPANLSINNVAVTEGNSGSTPAVFTVTLSATSNQTVTVDYTTANGTATAPSDYQSVNGTLSFPPGSTTRTISVPVNGDTTPEGNETFFVNLTNPTNAALTTAKGTGTINDDDATSIFQFSSATASVNENAVPGSATLTVTRTGDTTGAASVKFETSDGSAQQRSDYIFGSGVVQFAPGDVSKTISILIVNDVFVEGPETFQVTLSNPSGLCAIGSPNSVIVTINDDDAVLGTNPIDNAGFFVRQQYLDFLGREPDAGGLAFWTTNITSCGDPTCVALKRIDTSAAFFLSIEFQETSGNVLRTQRVAFGKQSNDPLTRVPYLQFMRDTRQVGQGVIIGQPGADALLEANKQNYAEQTVLDPNFTVRFPPAPAAVYVDALFASAGVTPTAAERTAAINVFGAGGTTGRIAALRSVADSNSVRQADANPSFVLAEYYGYLRRNPTDAPDFNDAGYQFWLTKLNSFNGDFRAAEMVKAFINSAEYRGRFGTP